MTKKHIKQLNALARRRRHGLSKAKTFVISREMFNVKITDKK